MKKRPYSKDFTPRGVPRQYRLAHIPPGMWAAAQARAKRQGLSMRALLLQLIQTWLASDETPPPSSPVVNSD